MKRIAFALALLAATYIGAAPAPAPRHRPLPAPLVTELLDRALVLEWMLSTNTYPAHLCHDGTSVTRTKCGTSRWEGRWRMEGDVLVVREWLRTAFSPPVAEGEVGGVVWKVTRVDGKWVSPDPSRHTVLREPRHGEIPE